MTSYEIKDRRAIALTAQLYEEIRRTLNIPQGVFSPAWNRFQQNKSFYTFIAELSTTPALFAEAKGRAMATVAMHANEYYD